MSTLRIVQVLSASTGGIGRHVVSLIPRLTAAGHQVVVCCPASTAAAHDFGDVELMPPRRLPGLLARADIVHAHGYKAGALAAAARAGRPGRPGRQSPRGRGRSAAPLVVTWHNAVLGRGVDAALGRVLQRVVARAADLTLGASSDLVEQARRLGARHVRLGAVAAPVLPAPRRPRDDVRAAVEVGPGQALVLTVGRLAPQKNLAMVLDVAARLRDTPAVFRIVGDGPERDALQSRIDAERLPVQLLGRCDDRRDLAELLAAADIGLLTSTWEARALVAQEALLAGLPLVSTRVGGIEELVGGPEPAAWLVAAGDTEGAAEAVRQLTHDPQRRADLRRRGLARAATWPDEDAVAADVLAAYAEAAARQIGPTRSAG